MPAKSDNEHTRLRRQSAIAVKGADAGPDAGPDVNWGGAPRAETAARIVAKGHGAVAEQILQLAFASGVKVREDANLAEILEAIEIDTEVPLHALAAVAEILNYVYRANDASAGRAPHNP